jgi:putative oxidoreductase
MQTAAILIARLIFAFGFAQAAAFKFVFLGMDATTAEIAGAGFPFPHLLAWIAGFFEVGLTLAFLTGLYFREAAIVSIAYVLFLAFSFHGPDHWAGNPMEYGFFTDHFIFIAGLLFAAVHGPGNTLVLGRRTT